jgi:TonB-dependent receptor
VARAQLAGGCPQNWVPMAQRCGVVAGTPFRPGEINPVNEVNKAFYGMLRFGGTVSDDVRITGNVGLRYTSTKRTASGYITFPTSIPSSDASCADALTQYLALPDPKPAFVPSAFCGLTPAVRQQVRNFNNGAVIADTKTVTQDYWLPSLNVKVALPNKVQLRLGLSKTITPPDIGLVRNYYNIALDTNATGILNGVVGGNTTVGNPLLKPTQSKNVDASVEWYFAPVGSLTFAAFYKRLTDVAANTTAKVPFTNNGATFDVTVTTPGNSDQAATVKGFEVGYQQFYDFLPKPLRRLRHQRQLQLHRQQGRAAKHAVVDRPRRRRRPRVHGRHQQAAAARPVQVQRQLRGHLREGSDLGPSGLQLAFGLPADGA